MCYMPKLYILIGLPASGKSTYAKWLSEYNNAVIISSDDIREKWYGSAEVQGDNNKIFSYMQKLTVENLLEKRDVIYDATNVTLNSRSFLSHYKPLLDIRKNISIEGVIFATPFTECCERNLKRDRVVPISVMDKMYRRFTPPLFNEGFDTFKIIKSPNQPVYNISEIVKSLKNFNQENPYHLETLGEHLEWCYEALKNTEMEDYAIMGLYHDIGKPYCKVKDDKGIAHYYNHECVSSYDTLCNVIYSCHDTGRALYLANLVRWHMVLYSHEFTDKQKTLFGEDMIRHLRIFNEIDRVARKR